MEMDLKQRFRYQIILDSYESSVHAASQKYGVSTSFIYKLRKRWEADGMQGLIPLSKAPKNPYRKVTNRIEELTMYFKRKLKSWGATRMRNLLASHRIDLSEPTIRKIWKKHGILPKHRKKRQHFSENIKGGHKNAYWQVDLLSFKLDDGAKFSALLAVDTHSRFITCLEAFHTASVGNVIDALKKAFVKDGRPTAIVTDNGPQFCPRFEGQNHVFEEFLPLKSIFHLRIPPRRPQKNGIVERAVQNVKNEALRPFKNLNLNFVQRRLHNWRNWYNFHRSHLGIRNQKPATLFKPYYSYNARRFLMDIQNIEIEDYAM